MVNVPLFSGIIIVVSYRGEACIIILQDVGMKFREKKIFFLSAKTPKNKTKPINTKKTKQQKHTASFEGMLKKKWRSDMNSI